MAWTLSNTNYNGEVFEKIYTITSIGDEVFEKGVANVHTDVSSKLALPRLSQTENPWGDFQQTVPSGETVTTTYAEREIAPKPMTLYELLNPLTFHKIWKKWASVGDFTNLEIASGFMQEILDMYQKSSGTQLAKLFWQGDTSLAANDPMNKFDGIITRALADVNVINVTPAGNITSANFYDILAAFWTAIPDKFLDDPDFIIHVNTTDWKNMVLANTNLKKDFVGVFGMGLEDMYHLKKIKHFQGMPRHHIFGAHATTGDDSNLHKAVWVEDTDETVIIDKVANNSRQYFIRLDCLMDVNYSAGEDCVLYKPA